MLTSPCGGAWDAEGSHAGDVSVVGGQIDDGGTGAERRQAGAHVVEQFGAPRDSFGGRGVEELVLAKGAGAAVSLEACAAFAGLATLGVPSDLPGVAAANRLVDEEPCFVDGRVLPDGGPDGGVHRDEDAGGGGRVERGSDGGQGVGRWIDRKRGVGSFRRIEHDEGAVGGECREEGDHRHGQTVDGVVANDRGAEIVLVERVPGEEGVDARRVVVRWGRPDEPGGAVERRTGKRVGAGGGVR